MTSRALIFLSLTLAAPAASSHSVQESGAEERIAFHSSGGGTPQVYIMHVDGSGRTQLTDNSSSNVAPEISPDGSQIVFVSDRDGTDHLYLMDMDGGRQRRVTDSPTPEGEPTWSPGGDRIYFRKELEDGRVVICAINTDGSGFRQLTDGSIRYLRASASPDGALILAISVSRGFELYLMNIDGSDERKIPGAPDGVAFASWSPDGEAIVYTLATPPPNISADIYVISPDGTGNRRLTHAEGASEYPCWSPDGMEIAFQTSRDGDFEIYVMSREGSNPRRLTDHPGVDGRPSWRIIR